MIAFLRSTGGRWAVRLVGLAISWLVVTQAMGMAWHGDGHAFPIVMFLIAFFAIAYAFDLFVATALTFAGAAPVAMGKPRFKGTIPPLSGAKQAKVRKLINRMAKAGVFAPEAPDPALAFAAFAVDKQPIDWVGVLQSLAEADYYHPDCNSESWSENLAWDHLPAGWQQPGDGRVLAYLW